jgi:hypothetical protein
MLALASTPCRRAQILLAFRRHVIRAAKQSRDAQGGTPGGRRGSQSEQPLFFERMTADNKRKHTSAMMAARLEESPEHRSALVRAQSQSLEFPIQKKLSVSAAAAGDSAAADSATAGLVEQLRQEMREGLSSLRADVHDLRGAVAKLVQLVQKPTGDAEPPPP